MQLAARVALLAALFIASACAGHRCASDSYGKLRGLSLPLAEISIPYPHTAIEIPNTCPFGSKYVGVQIIVCDGNGSPKIMATSLHRATIHLRGPPRSAVAYITERCDPHAAGSQGHDVDDDQSENSSAIAYKLSSDE